MDVKSTSDDPVGEVLGADIQLVLSRIAASHELAGAGAYAREANHVYALGAALEKAGRVPLFEADYRWAYKDSTKIIRPRADIRCKAAGEVPELWVEVKLASLEAGSTRIGGEYAPKILRGYALDAYKLAALVGDSKNGLRCALIVSLRYPRALPQSPVAADAGPGAQRVEAVEIPDGDRLYEQLCQGATLNEFAKELRDAGIQVALSQVFDDGKHHHQLFCAHWLQKKIAGSTYRRTWPTT